MDLAANRSCELLNLSAMGRADLWTIESGVPGAVLMDRAGLAVAAAARDLWDGGRILVLAGPGNNGGDGFVAAQRLATWGFPVEVLLLGERSALRGDAAVAAAAWQGPVRPLGPPGDLAGIGLVIDALFGAGLSRPLPEAAAAWAVATAAAGVPVLAVDLPSGVDGADGSIRNVAFQATDTVTFGRAKPGHLLLPGALHVGNLTVADIGLAPGALARAFTEVQPPTYANRPDLWRTALPRRLPTSHKYLHGHAVVVAGGIETGGAGRLAARAALATGAGLVTLAAPRDALAVHAARLEAVMVRGVDAGDLGPLLDDPRRNAWLLGPGGGVGDQLRRQVEQVLERGRAAVLDADALTTFAGDADRLGGLVRGPCVLTPHAGEAARLGARGDKLGAARSLAAATQSVVALKGYDTVVAAPDGRAAIATNGQPGLATAGSGDVLAGIVLALLAQGMDPFLATAAAVWLHGEAAAQAGPALTAEALPGHLRHALTVVAAITT